MRHIDQDDTRPLPPPIRKTPQEPRPEAERWTPISGHPDYERNQRGDVRRTVDGEFTLNLP